MKSLVKLDFTLLIFQCYLMKTSRRKWQNCGRLASAGAGCECHNPHGCCIGELCINNVNLLIIKSEHGPCFSPKMSIQIIGKEKKRSRDGND